MCAAGRWLLQQGLAVQSLREETGRGEQRRRCSDLRRTCRLRCGRDQLHGCKNHLAASRLHSHLCDSLAFKPLARSAAEDTASLVQMQSHLCKGTVPPPGRGAGWAACFACNLHVERSRMQMSPPPRLGWLPAANQHCWSMAAAVPARRGEHVGRRRVEGWGMTQLSSLLAEPCVTHRNLRRKSIHAF